MIGAADIVAKLKSIDAVTALIGARIYPEYVREADHVYPLAVYATKETPDHAFDGDCGIGYATLIIAAIDRSYLAAEAVAKAILAALDTTVASTWGTIYVQGCFLQDDGVSDDVVTDPTTEEILYYVKNLTFDLAYST